MSSGFARSDASSESRRGARAPSDRGRVPSPLANTSSPSASRRPRTSIPRIGSSDSNTRISSTGPSSPGPARTSTDVHGWLSGRSPSVPGEPRTLARRWREPGCRASSSCASTTRVGARWPPPCSNGMPPDGSGSGRPAQSPPTVCIPPSSRSWPRSGSTLARERPKLLETRSYATHDVVITMGCGDACPVFPGVPYEDWDLEDPSPASHSRMSGRSATTSTDGSGGSWRS